MGTRLFYTSLTRTSDLRDKPFDLARLDRGQWADGDFVECRVKGKPSALYHLELQSGRMVDVLEDDRMLGVLGKRQATLEGVGDWCSVGDNLEMEALTSAGLMGKSTSLSPFLPRLLKTDYVGHVMRNGEKVRLSDFVIPAPSAEFDIPVILLVGSSMSAGKTTTGRIIVHELSMAGHDVVGAKFTGAGRFRDIQAFRDAGARVILDFVDAGLASTVTDEQTFAAAMDNLLSRIAAEKPDVLVAEAGASPLEAYNGAYAFDMLKPHLKCTVLCTSDPYSVLGVQQAFNFRPDLVAGPATSTDAGVDLVKRLTGIRAINIMEPASRPELRAFIADCLGLEKL